MADSAWDLVADDSGDPAEALSALGVPIEVLLDALRQGESAARLATQFHPVTTAGTSRWFDTVAGVRREMATVGWRNIEVRSAPRTVNEEGTIAIAVTSGNVRTGLRGGAGPQPRSARAKGPATLRSVQVNGQLAFDIDLPGPADVAADVSGGTETWFLLYFREAARDGKNAQLRAELSLPVGVTETGYVSEWGRRIILPAIDLGNEVVLDDEDDDGSGVSFDVELR